MPAANIATSLKHVPATAVPFLITNQPDGHLPNMDGYELQRLGSQEKGWHSLCPIRAGRDLVEGEIISACLVRERDGEMVRIDYIATKGALKADQWPKAFAQYISDNGNGLGAGGWNDKGELTCDGTVDLRLWCRNHSRAFSTAPFANNQVQALACDDDYALASGQSLCLQVRDLNTQHLYEQHIFTPAANQTGNAWSQALCTQINQHSRLLRAGVFDAKTSKVTPAVKGNAFWVAQCAGLSVTLAEVGWWPAQVVQGSHALTEGQTVQAWAYDAYSHRLLGTFSWVPTAAQCASGKWLSAWATALNASSMSEWLLASDAQPKPTASAAANAKQLTLWQRGEGVRVFTSLPAADNWVAGPRLDSVWGGVNDAVLVTVRQPYSQQLLGHTVFRPKKMADQNAWEAALAAAVAGQKWPQLVVGREAADGGLDRTEKAEGHWRLWQPRFAGLLVDLQNLGDSDDWEADRLQHYLLATDGSSESVTKTSMVGRCSFEVTACSHREDSVVVKIQKSQGELVFRLSAQASLKGYRVADCDDGGRQHSTDDGKEIAHIGTSAVYSDMVVWGAGSVSSEFTLILDYPEACRDAKPLVVGHIGYLDDNYIWQSVSEVKFTPPAARPAYVPHSPLCEDYGNTMSSQIFDAGGASETGVDPRTGLFHAHYPIATLQGVGGRGPVCELTLHYSALRGNEAGLGDGWAWRFASLETRDQRLTLADGTTITFTGDEWATLAKGTRVTKKACFISSNPERTVFTLDLPTGRQEVLSEPAAAGSDTVEHNDEFRKEVIRLFKAIKAKTTPKFPSKPSHWTQYALAAISPHGYSGAAMGDYIEAVKAWAENTKELDERIAYYERASLQLLPSRIVSPYGETLELSWQRKEGQFLLRQVKSGAVELFNASYTASGVEMNVWPTNDSEKFQVNLTMQDHLLRTFKRSAGGKETRVQLQQVDCDYSDDPTLDRVLYRLQELDGSVERVDYDKGQVTFSDGRPALPRVGKHFMLPGSGSANRVTRYTYKGSYVDEEPNFGTTLRSGGLHESKRFGRGGEMLASILCAGEVVEFEAQSVSHPSGKLMKCVMSVEAARLVHKNLSRRPVALPSQLIPMAKAHAEAEGREDPTSGWKFNRSRPLVFNSSLNMEEDYVSLNKNIEEACLERNAGSAYKYLGTYFELLRNSLCIRYNAGFESEDSLGDISFLADLLSFNGVLPKDLMDDMICSLGVSGEDKRLAVNVHELCTGIGNALHPYSSSGNSFEGLFEATLGAEYLSEELQKILVRNDNPTSRVDEFNVLTYESSCDSEQKLLKTLSPDNTASYRCYYPAAASSSNPLTPSKLVKGFKDFPALSCPATPEGATPPLMAEYQCDAHGNPLGLILYGYRAVTRNARQVLETSNIVTLEGIKGTLTDDRLDSKVVWTQASPDEPILWRVSSTSSTEPAAKTPNEGKVRVWSITNEQITVLGDQRVKLTTVQSFEDNPTAPGLKISTSATTVAGTHEVSREMRSRFSRRCLSKTLDGVQTVFEHDGLGRVTKQSSYRLNAKNEPEASAYSVINTDYGIEHGGLSALVSFINGSQRRDWLDGLQRVVRSEWRRTAKDGFIPLSRNHLHGSGDDDGAGSRQWDYLPGGQAICEPLQRVELPGRHPWSRDLLDPAGTVIQGLGAQTLLRSTNTFETLANGHMTRSEAVRSSAGIARADTVRQFDSSGRLIELTRTVDGQSRTHQLQRDGLGRVTRHIRPDGSVVKRSYHAMSDHVTELKVFSDSKDTTVGQVIGTQEIEAISTLSKRKVGSREYKFKGENVTLPDSTSLTLTEAGDSGQYRAGDLNMSSVSRSGSVTTLSAEQGTEQLGSGWQHSLTASQLPGKQRLDETTPRSTHKGLIWKTLRGLTVAALRADGHWQRVFSDHHGRPLRSWHDHEDVLHRHDDHGRQVERRVHAQRAGAQWQVNSEHDAFGQETLRSFSHNGQLVFAQQLKWRSDGQLLAKHSREAGTWVRSEQFDYDALDRLIHYTCTAADASHLPRDGQGKAVKAQRFTWDVLSNLEKCVTTFEDDKTSTQEFAYHADNPTRLKTVTTDKKAVQITHSANGYLTEDGKHRKLDYNKGGQLTKVSGADSTVQASYVYDGYQRLAAQYIGESKAICELRYAGDLLIGEDWFDAGGALTRQRSISPGLAEYEGNAVNWLIDDPQSGVAGFYSNATLQLTPLLPFGEGAATMAISSGYNGMRRDPVTGSYHAGNGYRCYDPSLGRYTQPDWLSPFGEGGLNDYVHCPDPVNQHDPSGAIVLSRWGQSQLATLEQGLRDAQPFPVGDRWRRIGTAIAITLIGIVASVLTGGTASMMVFGVLTALSVASLVFEVAAILVEDSYPELGRKLSIASAVTGVLSIGNFAGVFKQSARLLKSAASLAVRVVKNTQRGLQALWKIFNNVKRYGFAVAGQMFTSSRKAVKTAREAAKAAAQTAKSTVVDALGELASPQFAVVEKDWLLKMASGSKFHVLTGWKGNFYFRATQHSKAVKLAAEAVEWGDNVMDYHDLYSALNDSESQATGGRSRLSSLARMMSQSAV
ncbi:RHS repeat-associated core domain-containing protein [Pseudomonas promysalinigenes]|uniref:RHS repeat-associated core domain-containing protein n=1 Tax=Pseudomonas promysalinigenes TaxID=485898 RepID=UPI001649388A|nr:RHS repeat-associated core domain-containing protein [Pseudomonas promysalinigenes]QXI35447.1 hypothetical protein HU725_009005 [Pseudomonas promysalinigenes]